MNQVLRQIRQINISLLAYAGMLVFFALFFVYPIATTLKEAFIVDGEFTFSYVRDVLQDKYYLEGLLNATIVAIFSTLGSILIALPLAVIADRYNFPFKSILLPLLLVPLVLPPFVGAIGVKQILGQSGSLNIFLSWFGLVDPDNPVDWLGRHRFLGMILMNALHLYPIVYLNVSSALANLDPALEEASENLGSSPIHRFFYITLPLTLPGLFAGSTIAFIWAFTELGVPLIFDFTRITSVQIFDGIKDLGASPFPYALVAVVLFITSVIFLTGKKLMGNQDLSSSGRASVGRHSHEIENWSRWLVFAFFLGVVLAATVPHFGVLLVSTSTDWYASILPQNFTLQHYEEALGHVITVPSIGNSLKYAGLATILNLIIGISIAYVVVRTKMVGRQFLDALSMLPLAVPGLVLAFGYLAMTREGKPFHFLVNVFDPGNPFLLLVIAYAVRRLPYIVRSAVAGFQQTSRSLEEASASLGAGPLTTMRRITVPLIAANLIAGAILAFAFSMLEVSDSLILAQKQAHFPITTAIYSLFGSLGNGPFIASALGVWAMAFLTVAIVGAGFLLGKKMGALFRA
tara:strand:- start:3341 stop:5065 length:1725 start_codon:yes stop_codon:yes gene_type:complete